MMKRIRTENRRANAWRKVAVVSAIALLGATQTNAQTSISSWTDLAKIGNDVNYPISGNYLLTRDLTEQDPDYGTVNGGFTPTEGWMPIEVLTGTFDGGGHSISGLWIDSGFDYQGLFGQVHGGTINNLGVNIASGKSVSGAKDVGGIAGWATSSTFANCYVTGNVNGGYSAGGLVGRVFEGNITGCYVTGHVSGNGEYSYIGGLVGEAYESTSIIGCFVTGDVDGNEYIGGLVGIAYSGTSIAGCYTTGDVSGIGEYIGGLVGNANDITLTGCYATGDVIGSDYVGGLVGCFDNGSLSDSFALNSMISAGTFFGRVLGYFYTCYLDNNYALETMAFPFGGGGTSGNKDGEDISLADAIAGRGIYEAAGWDFVNVWVDAPYAGFNPGPDANLPILRACADAVQNPHLDASVYATYAWYWDPAQGGMITNALGWKFQTSANGLDLTLTNCFATPGPATYPLDFSGGVEGGRRIVSIGGGVPGLFGFGGHAFRVGSLVLPDEVEEIAYAFQSCANMTSVDFGGSALTNIGNMAFMSCAALREVAIPDSVKRISNSAFWANDAMTNLTLGMGVESIDICAFANCSNIVGTLDFPAAVSNIWESAFENCSKIKGISFELAAPSLIRIDTKAFAGCTALAGDLVLPQTLLLVGTRAFEGAALTSITTPSYAVIFAQYAFYTGSPTLTAVHYTEGYPLTAPGDPLYYAWGTVTSYVDHAYAHTGLAGSWETNLDPFSPPLDDNGTARWKGRPIVCLGHLPVTTYQVRYRANGGGGDGSDTLTYTNGVSHILWPADTFTAPLGYTFQCWSNDYSGLLYAAGYDTIHGDLGPAGSQMRLFAQWAPNAYKVWFWANNGEMLYDQQDFTYDEEQALMTPGYTRVGYTLEGWADSFNVKCYDLGETVSNLTAVADGIVHLFGYWERMPDTWVVTLDPNYPPGSMVTSANPPQVAVTNGQPMVNAILPYTGIPAPNYAFIGYTNSVGKLYYDEAGVGQCDWDVEGDGILYGVWVNGMAGDVAFYGNGGDPGLQIVRGTETSPGSGQFTYNLPATDPTHGIYNFYGWNTQPDGSGGDVTQGGDFPFLIPFPCPSVYATWITVPPFPDETWVHVDVIRVSPGGDVDLEWAFADIETRLGVTTDSEFHYVIEVCTDLTLMNWVTCVSADLGRSFGNDSRRVFNNAMPVSDKRFFKVKAVKD